MAVRTDASGDNLTRATGPTGDYTLALWVRIVNDRNNYSMLASRDTGGDYLQLGCDADGTSLSMYTDFDGGTTHAVTSLTVGNWHFAAYTQAVAGNGTAIPYYGTPGSALTAASSFTSGANTGTLYIGNSGFGEWFDGRVANLMIWDRVLSAAELANQMRQYVPVSPDGLHLWAPLLRHTELVDFSGNGRTLTAGGTLTTEDGPPIPWRRPTMRFFRAPVTASGTTGTGAVTATSSLAGSGTPVATGTSALSATASLAAAGTPVVTGTSALAATAAVVGAGEASGLTGTGAVTAEAAVVGAGTPVISGTSALSSSATLAGAGTPVATGTSALSSTASVAAAGTPVVTGTGALEATASVVGSGVAGATTGTGAVTASAAVSGSGTPVATGTGALGPTASVSGAGWTQAVTGTGAVTATASVSGVGTPGVPEGSTGSSSATRRKAQSKGSWRARRRWG